MDIKNIGRVGALLAAMGIWLGASSSARASYYFTKITDNGNIDVSSQLYFQVSGSGQDLYVTFYNNVGIASSVTEIYVDAPPPAGSDQDWYFSAVSITGEAGNVDFRVPSNKNKLPGQNGAEPDFVAVANVSADSESPTAPNGINASGDSLTLKFTLQNFLKDNVTVLNYDRAIADLNSGQLRFGLHVQSIGTTEGSDSYVSAVPEPTTLITSALLLLPFGMSTVRALRNRKS